MIRYLRKKIRELRSPSLTTKTLILVNNSARESVSDIAHDLVSLNYKVRGTNSIDTSVLESLGARTNGACHNCASLRCRFCKRIRMRYEFIHSTRRSGLIAPPRNLLSELLSALCF